MDAPVKSRSTHKPAITGRQDLRAWIAQLRAAGELQDITGAEREKEIGGIVDIYQRTHRQHRRCCSTTCLAFRAATASSPISSPRCGASTSRWGLSAEASAMDLVRYWRNYMKEARDHSAGHGESRAAHGERRTPAATSTFSKSRRRAGTSTTAAITSAPAHGDHARPGHRLDQLRRLSRAGAGAATSRR